MKIGSYIPRLSGAKVDLCVLATDPDSLEQYAKWYANPEINKWVHANDQVQSIESTREWAESTNKDNNSFAFTIVEKTARKAIGTCTCGVWGNARNGSLGIYLGEEHGKGYGTEAINLLLKFCFEELNTHRVELSVFTDNERAIKCYTKCGFKKCGVKHQCSYFEGSYRDLMQMEILRKDWEKTQKKAKRSNDEGKKV